MASAVNEGQRHSVRNQEPMSKNILPRTHTHCNSAKDTAYTYCFTCKNFMPVGHTCSTQRPQASLAAIRTQKHSLIYRWCNVCTASMPEGHICVPGRSMRSIHRPLMTRPATGLQLLSRLCPSCKSSMGKGKGQWVCYSCGTTVEAGD